MNASNAIDVRIVIWIQLISEFMGFEWVPHRPFRLRLLYSSDGKDKLTTGAGGVGPDIVKTILCVNQK